LGPGHPHGAGDARTRSEVGGQRRLLERRDERGWEGPLSQVRRLLVRHASQQRLDDVIGSPKLIEALDLLPDVPGSAGRRRAQDDELPRRRQMLVQRAVEAVAGEVALVAEDVQAASPDAPPGLTR